MAFNRSNAAATSAVSAPAVAVAVPGNWERAKGFLNIYLPSKDGKRRKVGAIALRESKLIENQILGFLEADEGNLEKLVVKLIFEYQSVAANESTKLDLA